MATSSHATSYPAGGIIIAELKALSFPEQRAPFILGFAYLMYDTAEKKMKAVSF